MKRRIHQRWKMVVIGFVLFTHVLIGYAARLFLHGRHRRAFHINMLQKNARIVLAVLGVELTVEGLENWREGQGYVVVSNHLSYVDTLLFAAIKPVCFVSTVEVKQTPFLGQIADCSGCLFVERRSREHIREEIQEMEQLLRSGFPLVFFPEGTSTDGSSVLEFKTSLFAPAQRAAVPILPAVVQYESLDGKEVSRLNRDHICWYADMEFAPHLFALAGYGRVKATLKLLPEIAAGEQMPREELAAKARAAIMNSYRNIT